jgi:hypothetical protein
MLLLAVDPGAGKTASIGVATFVLATGELKSLGKMSFDEFDAYLLNLDPKTIGQVVYEMYAIRRQHAMAHIGSEVEVVRSVGLVVAFANRNNIPCVKQPSSILGVAPQWFGVKIPRAKNGKKQHVPDEISAMLHGMYWLKGKGIIKTKLEEEMERNAKM